jgi:hypothetical protein
MAFTKGHKLATGRPKGSENKLTRSAKEAFQLAFEGLGGWEGMMAWAKRDTDNMKTFYTLYARLIPMDVTSGGNTLPAFTVTVKPPDGGTE